MNLEHPHVTIEEVLETLPHKFRSGKNVKIILDAYLKQYNKMLETYADSVILYNIDRATGDQLDRIGSNFMVRRDNANDDIYRDNIKLSYAIYKTSGNIANISKVFLEHLGINLEHLRVVESGNANIILELDRSYQFKHNIVDIVNNIISFSKPVGVGFSIEQFTNINIVDTYSGFTGITSGGIDMLIDRVKKKYLIQKYFMDDNLSLNEDYFYDIGIDRYKTSIGSMVISYMNINSYMYDNMYMHELIHKEE
ncbi:MAG: hypothetical protein ACRC7S_11520 [Cetobacterium sp.]